MCQHIEKSEKSLSEGDQSRNYFFVNILKVYKSHIVKTHTYITLRCYDVIMLLCYDVMILFYDLNK